MTCQGLDIPERSADGSDLTGGIGDERSASRMRGTSDESKCGEPRLKQIDDCLRGCPGGAFGADDVIAREREAGILLLDLKQADEVLTKVLVQRNDPSGSSL